MPMSGNITLLVESCRTEHAGEAMTEIYGIDACAHAEKMKEPRNALNSAIYTLQQYLGE